MDVVDWETEVFYEPPYTLAMSDEELKLFYESPLTLDIPSHSVLTERTIRDVDTLSTVTTSSDKRDGMIRALHKHRENKMKHT